MNSGVGPSKRAFLAALCLSLIAFVLILSSSWFDSPCFDEPEHIAAGFTSVRHGRAFMNLAHPPLVKGLAGCAIELLAAPPDLESWSSSNSRWVTAELFSGRVVPVQTLTRIARAPIVVLSSCFVGVFFLLLRQRFGNRVALLGSLLLLLSPTYLAHASLVHTDVAAAQLCFLGLWFLAGYLGHPVDARRALAFALVSGTAVLVKFSALLLCPVYLIAITCMPDRRKRWKQVVLVAVVVLGLIHAVYSAHPCGRRFHRQYLNYHFGVDNKPVSKILFRAAGNPVMWPWAQYATGVLLQGRRISDGNVLPGYLAGRVYYGGDSSYFPIVLLTKIPLGFWLLAGLSLWWLRGRMNSEMRLYAGFAVGYFLLAASANLNLGIRHVLPVFPCLIVLIAEGLNQGLERARGKAYKVAVGFGFSALLCANLAQWPNYLGHFNLLTMGRVPVVDSNFDWGTDLYRLTQRAEAEDWKPLYVSYFGGISPGAYLGERYRVFDQNALPTEGWAAISSSLYIPLTEGDDSGLPESERLSRAKIRDWLRVHPPVESVGTFVILQISD